MIGSTLSEPTTLKVGSPQGAILSPTVFIILVADMELYCPEAQICGYTDDTTVSVTAKSLDSVKEKCELAVNNLLTYMVINKLSCNNDKTHILVLKHGQVDRTLTFDIGEAKIKESKEEKLLGVWVSNDLKWTHHIEKLESNLRSRLYSLRKMEQVVWYFSLDPFLQKGSSLQVENLFVCLSVCHHFKISNIGPLYHPRITPDPTYHILLGRG